MPDEPRVVFRTITEYWSDGRVTWKPAGAKTTDEDDWVDGPACPVHGPWSVRERKDGSGWFYTCKVPKGEPWCKKKVSTRPGTWGAENPPGPQQEDEYGNLDDLPFG